MSTICTKPFQIVVGGCPLDTCTTAAAVTIDPGSRQRGTWDIAYAPDLCYCLVILKDIGSTTSYFCKYDPVTNTLIEKASISPVVSYVVYDAAHQLFVAVSGTGVIAKFDPQTETLSSFATGIVAIQSLVYVPEKGKIYGHMGYNGSFLYYVGYIDLDASNVVQIDVIPQYPPFYNPAAYNFTYSPISDSLYGVWTGASFQKVLKFDLGTNTGSNDIGVSPTDIYARWCCWDSDRSLLLKFGGYVDEINTATDTITTSTQIVPALPTDVLRLLFTPYYVSSLGKVFACGVDNSGSAHGLIGSYDTTSKAIAVAKNDLYYFEMAHLAEGGFVAFSQTPPSGSESVRRLCLT